MENLNLLSVHICKYIYIYGTMIWIEHENMYAYDGMSMKCDLYESVTLSELCEIWLCYAMYEIVEYAQHEKCYVWIGLCETWNMKKGILYPCYGMPWDYEWMHVSHS